MTKFASSGSAILLVVCGAINALLSKIGNYFSVHTLNTFVTPGWQGCTAAGFENLCSPQLCSVHAFI